MAGALQFGGAVALHRPLFDSRPRWRLDPGVLKMKFSLKIAGCHLDFEVDRWVLVVLLAVIAGVLGVAIAPIHLVLPP
jgi:hypothetical protein